jgi:hypothetical protein
LRLKKTRPPTEAVSGKGFAWMDQKQIMLEEYKALRETIKSQREGYSRLEYFTFAGYIVIYGV